MENLIMLTAFLSAYLTLLLVCAGLVWIVLKFNIEVKHHKTNKSISISYSRAKVGSILKTRPEKEKVLL